MAKHLSLSERTTIERALILGSSFKNIGMMLGRSPTTISREVKNNRVFVNRITGARNDCTNFNKCLHKNLCPEETKYSCFSRCKFCDRCKCTEICKDYESSLCENLNDPPYVCNNCVMEKSCKKQHAYYSAHKANAAYEKQLSESRKGIRTPPEKLAEIDELISPLIRKGQSLNHILSNHGTEIGLSEKTLYNYVNANVFKAKDIHLPKKVSYRPRKNDRPVLTHLEYKYRRGREWDAFQKYMELHPDAQVVEMDTVKGARGSKKVLLTFIFSKSNFMIAFLLKDGSKRSVLSVFDFLTENLGLTAFRKLFPVILTDNGVEFKDPMSLEYSASNARRTNIFYCDPQASWQKPHIEKNHVELRKILPKGTSFSKLTGGDVSLLLSHINSESREVLQNKSPFSLFTGENEKKLLNLLHLSPVPADEVTLSPRLLNLRNR